jgi:chaperonin GroEL
MLVQPQRRDEGEKGKGWDALNATRAAVEEGIVYPVVAFALLRCVKPISKLELPGEEQNGVNIVMRALEEPIVRLQIMQVLRVRLLLRR